MAKSIACSRIIDTFCGPLSGSYPHYLELVSSGKPSLRDDIGIYSLDRPEALMLRRIRHNNPLLKPRYDCDYPHNDCE